MSAATPPLRRRTRNVVRLLLAVFALVAILSSCTPQQAQVTSLVNRSRAGAGVHALRQNLNLDAKAQGWAEHLSRQGQLSHSTLSSGVNYPFRLLGENVGYGGSIEQVHQAFLNSPGHRANIMDRQFDFIGTGVAYGRGRVWVVQVFMDL